MEACMDSSHYTPRLGFWMATTLVLIITTFPLIFLGAFSGNEEDLWTNFGLLMIPSSCAALLQAFLLASRSLRVQWFGITVAGTAIGWGAVLLLGPLLGRLQPSSTLSDQFVLAALDGFVTGAPMGVIVGLVTGIIQGRIQPLSARELLVGNLISWSIGIGMPFALLFAAFSQIRLF
jgi:hypothetical protein